MTSQRKARRPFLAAGLSLLTPGTGQLYNGELRQAFVFLAIGVLASLAMVLLDGFLPPVESLTGFVLKFVIAYGLLAIWIASIVKAFRYARRVGDIELRPYNKWWVYLAIPLAMSLPSFLLDDAAADFQLFNIPSGSMSPTLEPGDSFVVARSAYRDRLPQRGDVAVFLLPSDGETEYIKRIIGLPGDRIQMREGRLYINDEMVQRKWVGSYVIKLAYTLSETAAVYEETLPNGVTHRILERSDNGPLDNTPVFAVPPGHYFAMGDNRDNSQDSRARLMGIIPAENFVGRATFVFFSTAARDASLLEIWKWLPETRMDRIGAPIR